MIYGTSALKLSAQQTKQSPSNILAALDLVLAQLKEQDAGIRAQSEQIRALDKRITENEQSIRQDSNVILLDVPR